jgi:serine/threonine protein kinase
MDEHYEIRCKIGQSALGTVYRGFDRRSRRNVALKRLSTRCGDDSFRRDPFGVLNRQLALLAAFDHPNVVAVHELGTDGGDPVLVMDFAEGESLDHRLERSALEWPEFRALVIQSLDAVGAAHRAGIIHGDLKPSNFMIEPASGHGLCVRLLDFGLAELVHPLSDGDRALLEAPLDSLHCMAPERFERNSPSQAADLYSLGCVLYQALALRYPFEGRGGDEIMDAHLRHRVAHLSIPRPDLPPWLCEWVMWFINRYPADRPASAPDALAVFLANESTSMNCIQATSGEI